MKSRENGHTQIASSARAGISERSGREIESARRIDPHKKPRRWRTRPDPLQPVWESELVPMLEKAPALQPITLLEHLQDHHGADNYPDRLLRTLQRRIKHWRATSGPDKEVMFRQNHPPGERALSDFTKLKNVTITIKGEPLKHILYHFRLSFSCWSYMRVTLGGESYTALAEGLQCALWRLGGSPKEHRTDSLSAAYKNLMTEEKKDITSRYEAFCAHYQMRPTRNNRGKGHENGSVEGGHGHLKRRIEQALLLRRSNDFDSVSDYQIWLDDVVSAYNCRHAKALHEEKKLLRPLPEDKTADYTDVVATVSGSSTIDVRRVTYTVPSRLIGQCLRIRLYDDRLYAYLGDTEAFELPRVYAPKGKTTRIRRIDYKHVIHSLIKKPQAFRHSKLRDDLLPSEAFKRIWQHVDQTMAEKAACRFMVGLLALAAKQPSEKLLAEAVLNAINNEELLCLTNFEKLFSPLTQTVPEIDIQQHTLNDYDQFITGMEVVDNE